MKRWAVLTVLLYLGALLVLTVPIALTAFGNWWWLKKEHANAIRLSELFSIYQEWGYWIWLAAMVLCQALLLLVPVRIAERRLPARKPLLTPVITAGLLMANIMLSALLAVLCAIFKEKAFEIFAYLGGLAWSDAAYNLFAKQLSVPILASPTNLEYVFGMIASVALLWLVWGVIFYRFARADNPNALMKRSTRWLLSGSILELLVAVPSHIIVRNRDVCCAPFGTFWGITTGLSVMLLSFGPGVFFLFAERFARLQPKQEPPRPEGILLPQSVGVERAGLSPHQIDGQGKSK